MELSNRQRNIGLECGLSKEILFRFLISHHNGSIPLRIEAENLLDDLSVLLSDITDYSFSNGITGVGWMIEFLAQQQLLCINTDEVLEDLDDNCYKMTLKCLVESTCDFRSIEGLLQYHHIRSESKNRNQLFYRHFIHNECLALLSDRLIKHVKIKVLSLHKGELKSDDLVFLSMSILKISHVMRTLEKVFEKVFYDAIEALLYYFKSFAEKYMAKNYQDYLYIHIEICMYTLMAVKQYDNPQWQNILEEIYVSFQNNLKQHGNLNNTSFHKLQIMDRIYRDPTLKLGVLERLSLMDNGLLPFYLSHYKYVKISEYL